MNTIDSTGDDKGWKALGPIAPIVRPAQPSFLPFIDQRPGSELRRLFIAEPQNLFRGHGLWLWGVTDDTLIHILRVGTQLWPNASINDMPARFFEGGMTFLDFLKKHTEAFSGPDYEDCTLQELVELDNGVLNGGGPYGMASVPKVPAHQQVRLPTCLIGNQITMEVSGPCRHAVLWGVSPQL